MREDAAFFRTDIELGQSAATDVRLLGSVIAPLHEGTGRKLTLPGDLEQTHGKMSAYGT